MSLSDKFNNKPVILVAIGIIGWSLFDFFSRVWYPLDRIEHAPSNRTNSVTEPFQNYSALPENLASWLQQRRAEIEAQELSLLEATETEEEVSPEASELLQGATEFGDVRVRVRGVFSQHSQDGTHQSLVIAEQQKIDDGSITLVTLRVGSEIGAYQVEHIDRAGVKIISTDGTSLTLRVFDF